MRLRSFLPGYVQQNYKKMLCSLFWPNLICVVSELFALLISSTLLSEQNFAKSLFNIRVIRSILGILGIREFF